ncbi:hypothetical protein GCM10011297_14290 [Bacterioplanes sanyensis]|uniref:SPOR domain-containing protein n=1 Tax=Bacterioplanes sanyensis TaxID=1249553 RepID=UPI001671FD85|nr:SPOR domain-containing protein [Bacterioplanes sanyensis]GGY42394.1 hypothetical protein GCM10011297_14290 [Bacterioplanes sanyensis]
MEQHLKKRIVGALVTVIAVAIVLPIFLDGNRARLPLTTDIPPMPQTPNWSDEQRERRVRIELEQLASGSSEQATTPEPQRTIERDDPAAPRTQGDRATLDDRDMPYAWSLQVGAFAQRANAEKLRDQLQADGFKSYLQVQPDSNWVRVYVGPVLQRNEAEALQARLRQRLQQQDVYIKRYRARS